MKTSWFFGDSFTQSKLRKNPTYLEFLGRDINNPYNGWSTQIANYLDSNEENYSIGGNSPQAIIDDFISNMYKFKKGDSVFISTSPMVRTIGYHSQFKKITSWNLETLNENSFSHTKSETHTFNPPDIIFKNKTLILDYVLNFIAPYEEEWEEYYENKIREFIILFKKQGINVYYWSWQLWHQSVFQDVYYETNGEIADDHWGIVGETQFLNYLKKRIKDGIYFDNTIVKKI